jgi:checkpoint serine/threonine-protein kinase
MVSVGQEFFALPGLTVDDSAVNVPRSPTMTFHTKAATDDVYEMFNQSLKGDSDSSDGSNKYSGGEDDDNGHDYSDEDDGNDTMKGEKPEGSGMSNLGTQAGQLSVNDKNEEVSTPAKNPQFKKGRAMPFMTPIAEATEIATPYSNVKRAARKSLTTVVNPTHDSVRRSALPQMETTLHRCLSYHHYGVTYGKKESIKRALSTARSKSDGAAAKLPIVEFPGSEQMFCLRKILGKGGFGAVYLAETGSGDVKAIKVEKTALPWEFCILRTAHDRLMESRDLKTVVRADSLFAFEDEQYMVMDFLAQGTLLDLINMINSQSEGNAGLEECVAMFFAIELLRAIETLHLVQIIHGDIKPDNVMVRLPDDLDADWDKYYKRDGSNGWESKGLVLVDFGRSIDMTMFPTDVQFIADWKMDEQDCIEMRTGKPWTYQVDYHGVAAVVYLLLFGKFIKTHEERRSNSGIWVTIVSSLKRYWQKDLWNEMFDCLLNSSSKASRAGVNLPITDQLTSIRTKFETWLEENCETQGVSLKTSLQRLQKELNDRKKLKYSK